MARKKRAGKKAQPKQVESIAVLASRDDESAYIRVRENNKAGTRSSEADKRAAIRFERTKEEEIVRRCLAALPKKFMEEWSGLTRGHIRDMAANYGVPAVGPRWSVEEFVRWTFLFLTKNGRHIKRVAGEQDPLLAGPASPAMEEYRRERVLTARLERQQLERELIPVRLVEASLQEAGSALRAGAVLMKQQCPGRAWEIFNEAIDNCDAAIAAFFARLDADRESAPSPSAGDSDARRNRP